MFSFCLWQLSSVVNTCLSCRNSIFELIRHQFCPSIPQSWSPGQLAGHRNWPVYAQHPAVAPLLQSQCWVFGDSGLLDRTHLRLRHTSRRRPWTSREPILTSNCWVTSQLHGPGTVARRLSNQLSTASPLRSAPPKPELQRLPGRGMRVLIPKVSMA